MLGAIIGDIVGSRFEFNNYKHKDFTLFSEDCFFTDDSVMTFAVAKAILLTEKSSSGHDKQYYQQLARKTVATMQDLGNRYPDRGYGGYFAKWLKSPDPQPYHSFGNGAAMRISPVGFFAATENEVKDLSFAVTAVTHNHSEGIKGAQATALAIFLARKGASKQLLRQRLTSYYDLDFSLNEIRVVYQFNETCQKTVPQAIVAFMEAESFEETIRNAISLGGDSDTLSAIAGSIAESYFGIPDSFKEQALNFLPKELSAILEQWQKLLYTMK